MCLNILSGIENKYIIDSFEDEASGVRYLIADYRYPFCKKNNIRRIEFENGGSFLYSSVFLSEKRDFQPLYPCAQKIVDAFFKRCPPKNALVLGCAGCTVPRFLLHRYRDCRVKGIEYSAPIIEIAKKYFISDKMKDRFELINDDAFRFVKEEHRDKYSLIFVDIFKAEKIHPGIFEPDFISGLYRLCDDNAAMVFNLFGLPESKARRFMESISEPFDAKYLIEDYRKLFLALIKTEDKSELSAFERRVRRFAEINLRG